MGTSELFYVKHIANLIVLALVTIKDKLVKVVLPTTQLDQRFNLPCTSQIFFPKSMKFNFGTSAMLQ